MNLYFDNASTSFPKPEALKHTAINSIGRGGTYGRASYRRAIDNVKIVESCRDLLGSTLGVNGDNIVFTKNATEASNLIISSLDLCGKKVLVSPLEHNAVMRPLYAIGADIEVMECGADGLTDINNLSQKNLSEYSLICVNHVSNVNGVVQPLDAIVDLVADKTKLFVDASQSAGCYKIPSNVDFAIFTAHKSLLGVVGVGGCYLKDLYAVKPLIYGGTGSNSSSYQMPNFAPDRYEAGTINILGIELLLSALNNPPEPKHTHIEFLELIAKLSTLENIEMFCASDLQNQSELFSIRPRKGSLSKFADTLYEQYNIELRKGTQCSPLAHRSLGTFPDGTLRFSMSPYHTKEDFDYLFNSIMELCQKY